MALSVTTVTAWPALLPGLGSQHLDQAQALERWIVTSWRELVASVTTSTPCEALSVGAGALPGVALSVTTLTAWRELVASVKP
jgi:hypothetical protein